MYIKGNSLELEKKGVVDLSYRCFQVDFVPRRFFLTDIFGKKKKKCQEEEECAQDSVDLTLCIMCCLSFE